MIGRTKKHSIRESLEENGNQSLKFHIGEKYERVVRSHPMKKVKIYGILPFDRPLLANHLWWAFLLHRLRGLDQGRPKLFGGLKPNLKLGPFFFFFFF
jgi:hypothetical protein